jgi:hypothetical protein
MIKEAAASEDFQDLVTEIKPWCDKTQVIIASQDVASLIDYLMTPTGGQTLDEFSGGGYNPQGPLAIMYTEKILPYVRSIAKQKGLKFRELSNSMFQIVVSKDRQQVRVQTPTIHLLDTVNFFVSLKSTSAFTAPLQNLKSKQEIIESLSETGALKNTKVLNIFLTEVRGFIEGPKSVDLTPLIAAYPNLQIHIMR